LLFVVTPVLAVDEVKDVKRAEKLIRNKKN